jgi:alpha-methylacyl-CoA racemase
LTEFVRHPFATAPGSDNEIRTVMGNRNGGALKGVRIIEFAGVGPLPFCAMLLADMGAEIVTLDRTVPSGLGIKKEPRYNPTTRSRDSIAVDLKSQGGRDVALRLIAQSDALIEGHRPGVMERLGLGPDACWKINPRLVFGRMTGWGQDGPLAQDVGHDLNYLAISGMLSMIGTRERPVVPLNLLGDLGGGGVYLALGLLAGILEAKTSGKGQVVDAAMIDGLASLLTHQYGFFGSNRWIFEREANFIDGGSPWYNVYQTSDGKHVTVASIEPKFYGELVRRLGLDPAELPDQYQSEHWPAVRQTFAGIFRSKTRDEWCAVMQGHETCFAPVLTAAEAAGHPHAQSRNMYVDVESVMQPAPAPRFSRTPSAVRRAPPEPGADTNRVLAEWGFSETEIGQLRTAGSIG